MTRLRFFLGLFGIPLAAQVTQKKRPGRFISSGLRKPDNGECPVCGTISVYKTSAIMRVWERHKDDHSDECIVACIHCNAVYMVDTKEIYKK